MNYRQKMERRRGIEYLFSGRYNVKEGVIKLNSGNTIEHELAKTLTAFEYIMNDFTVFTEVIFENGKRADIVVVESEEIIEIVNTETKKSIEKKQKEYPLQIKVLKAKDVISAWAKKFNKELK